MKVITPGREQAGWSVERNCTGAGNKDGGCGALLLVEQADVFQTHRFDYGGGHDVFNTFRCGACGVLTDLAGSLPFTPPAVEPKGRTPTQTDGDDKP
jgi:hypothetical protein